MNIRFTKLTEPTTEFVAALNRWENDPDLIPLIRPNKDEAELARRETVTEEELARRLQHNQFYLIYLDEQLIGELSYQVDPGHLYKKEISSAWIGITIGEREGQGKGIGFLAMQYLEEQIKQQGLKRIELGVFEFNTRAVKLYQKLGYQEIGRVKDFTYWQDRMWCDIRMEKFF